MWHAANMGFALCPMLTAGAIEAMLAARHAMSRSSAISRRWSTGEWTGTMNLTEPQAGSDLARCARGPCPKARHYRIYGQKIFITYGEHDFTENIVHLVLARTPDAPEGVKGISLFVVPKFLVNADGSSASATTCIACRSSTSWASTRARPRCWPSATAAARSVIWSARRTAASSTCSS